MIQKVYKKDTSWKNIYIQKITQLIPIGLKLFISKGLLFKDDVQDEIQDVRCLQFKLNENDKK